MNMQPHSLKTLASTVVASLLLAACAAGMSKPEGAASARAKLTQLQSDPQLATRAPVAIKDAELAVRAAEEPREDADLSRHLVFLADRKVDLAVAQAQTRLAEDQRKALSEQREGARLDSRTREADAAHRDATSARIDANIARSDASAARNEAEVARMSADEAKEQSEDLQRQLAELNARATDRGFVVTLGDVLFASGRSELRGGTASNLSKLAAFLNKYQDRTVAIEGHTDNVGSENANLGLSQRRADSVKAYLVGQGVASERLTASGKGKGSPVAGNDSTTGRQQNRRVEVIISNTVASSR
jgi:outer membrane protein OmpA-like peptidoglycan-associated protein